MALVAAHDLFKHAERHGYAVGAFNILNLEFLTAILDAATILGSPVILNVAEVHFPYVVPEQIAAAVKWAAGRVPVPVALNLDHGLSFDTVMRCLACGFTSVMYDASGLDIDHNIEETRLVVRAAHALGVSVEAELGRICGGESIHGMTKARRDCFTDPAQAERFVAETGVDALAVSVGNVHGDYDGDPALDFGLIEDIGRRTGIPLVLHGGSGIPDEDFRRAIGLGIRKINIYTDMAKAAVSRIRASLDADGPSAVTDVLTAMKAAVGDVVTDRITAFGSAGAYAVHDGH